VSRPIPRTGATGGVKIGDWGLGAIVGTMLGMLVGTFWGEAAIAGAVSTAFMAVVVLMLVVGAAQQAAAAWLGGVAAIFLTAYAHERIAKRPPRGDDDHKER